MAIDKNTLVLLHLDGNVKDECGHTFTATNIGYANAKFGQGAITKDHTSKIACKNPGFTLGGSDFTIDFWVKSTGSAEYGTLYSISWNTDNNDCYNTISEIVQLAGTHGSYCVRTEWSGTSYGPNFKMSDNVVHHVAVVYQHSKSMTTVYIDGKQVQTYSKKSSNRNVASICIFQEYKHSGTNYMDASTWIDEFRISSCARWTSNFTPPNAPYGDEGGARSSEL